MKDLQTLRTKIDSIDDDIADLLIQRVEIIKQVGKIKKANNVPVQNPEREQEVIKRLSKQTEGKVSKSLIQKLWHAIFANAYEVEENSK